MIQRIEGTGPPEVPRAPRGGPSGPERGPGDRRLEIVLIVARGIVGTALGAVVFLQALSSDAARITFLETATGERASNPRIEHPALDPARLHADVRWLADPARQGRDTPSRGLRDAQAWVAGRLAEAGAVPVAGLDVGTDGFAAPLARYAHLYAADAFGFGEWESEEVDARGCELVVDGEALVLERDFVPLTSSSEEDPRYRGGASGPAVFCGFGIDSPPEDYDDFRGLELEGAIAVVLDGEPSTGFAGSDVTAESSVWNKLDALVRKGAAGALVVSRHGARYRASRARWMPPDFDKERAGLPTLVVSEAAAERILGAPVQALREACSEAPLSLERRAALLRPAARVRLAAATRRAPAELINVVGLVPGTEGGAALVVVAHLDHIGVGPRGRIGHGADDNGSGVAAALGMLEAVAAHPLRRPVVFAFPSGEEDGLLGSRALRADLADAVGQPGLC
ncbi:MAG: M28 family peptidase, partial [Planctomycetota bacterium]